jgi:hypothetical protein
MAGNPRALRVWLDALRRRIRHVVEKEKYDVVREMFVCCSSSSPSAYVETAETL